MKLWSGRVGELGRCSTAQYLGSLPCHLKWNVRAVDLYSRALRDSHSQTPSTQLHLVLSSPWVSAGRAGGLRQSSWKSIDLAIRRPIGHPECNCSVATPTRAQSLVRTPLMLNMEKAVWSPGVRWTGRSIFFLACYASEGTTPYLSTAFLCRPRLLVTWTSTQWSIGKLFLMNRRWSKLLFCC